jgi:hypothetical protein
MVDALPQMPLRADIHYGPAPPVGKAASCLPGRGGG